MAEPSNALIYFRQASERDDVFGYLASLCAPDHPPVFETEWLEFKGCEKIDAKELKSYWSEALSGFANAGGGVLIWGIDARKDSTTQIDKVTGLSLYHDADLLAHRLKELLAQSVDPPVGGIEIKSIRKPGSKAGFVICFIPEGKIKPHRAEGAGRNYYLRIGTSFVIPPVSVLRSFFSPQAKPYLEPSIIVKPMSNRRLPLPLRFEFCLKNSGTVTAKSISMIISHPESLYFGATHTNFIQPPTVLHARIPLTLISPLNPEIAVDSFFTLSHTEPTTLQEGFVFLMQTSCEDSPIVQWKCPITHEDFQTVRRILFALAV